MAARKERIATQAELAATKAADQINEHLDAGKVPLNMLVPIFGVAVDKLRSDPTIRIEHTHVHAHSHRHFDDFNKLLEALPPTSQLSKPG